MNHTRFLPRDGAQSCAEVFHVIEAYRCDYRQNRPHHVGSVEPASHPHLQHGKLASEIAKHQESEHGQSFEIGRPDSRRPRQSSQLSDGPAQLSGGDTPSADDPALPEIHQVG